MSCSFLPSTNFCIFCEHAEHDRKVAKHIQGHRNPTQCYHSLFLQLLQLVVFTAFVGSCFYRCHPLKHVLFVMVGRVNFKAQQSFRSRHCVVQGPQGSSNQLYRHNHVLVSTSSKSVCMSAFVSVCLFVTTAISQPNTSSHVLLILWSIFFQSLVVHSCIGLWFQHIVLHKGFKEQITYSTPCFFVCQCHGCQLS